MHNADISTAGDAATATADLRTVARLRAAGLIDSAGQRSALGMINGPLVWWPWVQKALLFLGLSLVLCGVVCFFAWNWDALPGLAKLGIVEGAIIVCCGVALWKGLDTLAGKAAQTAAAVLVGVFLAVFGQVYQTGADAYELFVGWAALILPWVLMCRLAALWLMWVGLVNLALTLYWQQILVPRGVDWEWLPVALGLLNGFLLSVRERLASRGWDWLSTWLRWVLVPASLIALACPAILLIVEPGHARPGVWTGTLLLMVELTLLRVHFRQRTPDLFVLTCGATTVTVLACVGAVRFLVEIADETVAFFLSGLAVLSMVGLMARWLMQTRHSILAADSADSRAATKVAVSGAAPDVLTTGCTDDPPSVSTETLLARLVDEGHMTTSSAETAMALVVSKEDESDSTPWFIKTLIGFGAWVSCWMFVACFAAAGLFNDEVTLLFSGGTLLVAGAFLCRTMTTLFFRQLALAIGLTGLVLVCIGAADFLPLRDLQSIALAATLVTLVFYGPFHSPQFRFLSCVGSLTLITVWLVDDTRWFDDQEIGQHWGLHILLLLETLGVGLVFCRHGRGLLEPAGYALAFGLLGTLLLTLLPDSPSVWPTAVIQVVAQIWLLHHATATGAKRSLELFGIPAAGAVLLGLLSAPGLLASLGMAILGHLERNTVLKGLGLLFLPVYITAYYYNLESTLLAKSLVLAGTGCILWAARWYLGLKFADLQPEFREALS